MGLSFKTRIVLGRPGWLVTLYHVNVNGHKYNLPLSFIADLLFHLANKSYVFHYHSPDTQFEET